ncbi:hypothetical protein PAXRUDRAFT_565292 [Paxillus rubicundulus Ve08.2h10]|uniref:Uncharacterized protein n=1 Tax=Paxillus rubicundulus Ve08.2h10 TaxID=930991 RepID=A0A0D0ECE7_9AGAM|nr:hypothetical protein PAXRUDRAFT_565292 [Paxillus rubicundulus Ve08.2h10]
MHHFLTDKTRDLLWIKQRCPVLTISPVDWNELPPVLLNSIIAHESMGFCQCKVLFRFLRLLDRTSTTLRTVQSLANRTRLKARESSFRSDRNECVGIHCRSQLFAKT